MICDADSTTQVKALADNVEKRVNEFKGEWPWHMEGAEHQEWILLDYVDVVVHVFLTPLRQFYQLEELWSDGIIEQHIE